jgi:sRNA-binding protein
MPDELPPNSARPLLRLKLRAPVVEPAVETAKIEDELAKALAKARLSEQLIAWMRVTWPTAFAKPIRPLQIGAGALIIKARAQGTSRKAVRRALFTYTHASEYLVAVRDGVRRVGLDGSDAGEPEEAHRRSAASRLEARDPAQRSASR